LVWPNAAPATLDHAVRDGLGHVEHGVEVGLHDRIPIDLVHLLEGHVARDAGVVDQHVDGAHFLHDLGHASLGRIVVRHVAFIGLEVVTLIAHRGQPAFGLLAARRVRRHDLVAERSQLDADRFTQAAHAAGH
jgi:hypothetical protein